MIDVVWTLLKLWIFSKIPKIDTSYDRSPQQTKYKMPFCEFAVDKMRDF